MRESHVLGVSSGGFHRVVYTGWGEPDAARVAVCVHGLTGAGSDFEELAPVLADAGYRVVCPDVVGRGRSDWLADPGGYVLRQYVADMSVLLARLEVTEVDWVGTSMGGLIGMALAAMAGTPIRRLLLNDIGPFLPTAALQRLGTYLGEGRDFPDLAAAEAHLREVRAPFGKLPDTQWRRMAERLTRPAESGGLRAHYDPGVAFPFRETMVRDVDMWAVWDAIECPVRVLRGVDSDLLLAETAEEMIRRGPGAEVLQVSGRGHHPPLMDPEEIGLVVDWLS